MLMWYIWPEDFPRLALACLAHDVPEAWVGDIPAPTMRYVAGLRTTLGHLEDRINLSLGLPAESMLAKEDHDKLKACDRLEFWLWSEEQIAQGNLFAKEARDEIERYFDETPLPAEADALYRELRAKGVLPRQQRVIKELCE